MPLYTFSCDSCGIFDKLCSYEARDHQTCPYCQSLAKHYFVPAKMMLVGAAPSKPISVGGANATFDTNHEYRKYLRDNPNVKIVDRGDAEFKRFKDQVDDSANKMAARGGYKDIDHMRRTRAAEARRKKELG